MLHVRIKRAPGDIESDENVETPEKPNTRLLRNVTLPKSQLLLPNSNDVAKAEWFCDVAKVFFLLRAQATQNGLVALLAGALDRLAVPWHAGIR